MLFGKESHSDCAVPLKAQFYPVQPTCLVHVQTYLSGVMPNWFLDAFDSVRCQQDTIYGTMVLRQLVLWMLYGIVRTTGTVDG